MSSGEQGSKTKQELLEEYEKDYMARLENTEKESGGLQNAILQMTNESKKLEKKDYIGYCVFCTMGVPRDEMAYKNNRLFHADCFKQQGSNFPTENQELLTQNSNAKVELILLKNLKVRYENTSKPPTRSKPKSKKKSKRKTKKRRLKRRTARKRKTRRRPSKKRRASTRRKTKRRFSSRTKRRNTRKRPSRRSRRRR